MWKKRWATFVILQRTISSSWNKVREKKQNKTTHHISTFPVLSICSVFQFGIDAANSLFQSCIHKEVAIKCLEPLQESILKMHISQMWVGGFYSFNNMHNNKRSNTQLFIIRNQSVFHKRWIKSWDEFQLTASSSLWALKIPTRHRIEAECFTTESHLESMRMEGKKCFTSMLAKLLQVF